MKNKILEIIKDKPKHYSLLVKKDEEMNKWVQDHSITSSTYYPEMIYSALYNENNVCKYGNTRVIKRISDGWIGCGPANKCRCTAEAIAEGVTKTKRLTTPAKNAEINAKRAATMIEKFGVPFSLQRPSVKKILSKSKLTDENAALLNNKDWLYNEYVTEQKTLTEIAKELNIYYGTVGEYCRMHGFAIRQRTNYSMQEKEICEFITSLNVNYIHSDWDILHTYEIDVYIPDYKFGIELNGLYWHSFNPYCAHTPGIENKNKHKNKTDLANTKGIDLIHITDFEWANKTEILKSIIKTKVGLSNKIYARKCIIKDVDIAEEREFLTKNHLQGYVASSNATGLYIDNELYMLMTFGAPRYSKIADIELLRLCTKLNYVVVGGAARLFNNAKIHYLNKTFISYCDLSKFNGASYSKLGFKLLSPSNPSYYWTDGSYPISRYKCQKHALKKWLPTFDETKSESENMFLANYRRYWDCGQSSWVYNTTKS